MNILLVLKNNADDKSKQKKVHVNRRCRFEQNEVGVK